MKRTQEEASLDKKAIFLADHVMQIGMSLWEKQLFDYLDGVKKRLKIIQENNLRRAIENTERLTLIQIQVDLDHHWMFQQMEMEKWDVERPLKVQAKIQPSISWKR